MKRNYRSVRVRVTDKILNALIALIKREGDYKKPKKHPARWYRSMVADILNLEEKDNPSVRSYEERLKTIRESFKISNPVDELWTLGTLNNKEYYITPEAVPAVTAVYKICFERGRDFTIREALWVARLCKLLDTSNPANMSNWATAYALGEWISEIDGKESFDSAEIDMELIRDAKSIPQVVRELEIWGIAVKYDADPVKLKKLNLSLEETEEIAKSGKYGKEADNEGTLPGEA